MLIGIDASRSCNSIQKTGVERVSDELIKALWVLKRKTQSEKFKAKEDFNFVFYTPELMNWLPREKQRVIRFKRLWTVLGLSLEMFWRRPDVLFIPVHTLPLFCPKRTFKIIHDVAFVKNPAAYSLASRIYLNFDTRRCVKKCPKIIVPTNQVKHDLIRHFGAGEEQVMVVQHGYARSAHKNIKTQEHKNNQILYIGRIEKKKNIANLIAGFEIFSRKCPDYKLILAGKPGHGFDNVKCQMSNVNCDYLGYITDEAKFGLISQSSCLALVSREEGFGLPILEAFDMDTPALASDTPVLREVGQEACLYVNPDDPADIARGLERIISDHALRERLVSAGRQRLAHFSWDRTARIVLDIIAEFVFSRQFTYGK